MQKSFTTHVDLSWEVREKLIATLNTALASSLDLYTQVKQAHWNIKGPEFFARHELFDELADHVRKMTDRFAERAATLGGYAKGTLRLAGTNSVIPEYDLEAISGKSHILALVERYATFTGLLRTAINQAASLGDPPTEDLYVESLRQIELDLWFLESHITQEREAAGERPESQASH